jgi:hypothetical protein
MNLPQHGFLAYATANDPLGYCLDRANFGRMLARPAGVERIDIGIAVSEARPRSARDEREFDVLARRLEASGRFRVVDLFFKPNAGRDFSSWRDLLKRFRAEAVAEDHVLMLNRSAFGPLQDGWYRRFMTPFEGRPRLAVCGASINFEYQRQVLAGAYTHVQTYAWMSRFGILDPLLDAFPGGRSGSRAEAIRDGEVALGQHWLDQGWEIACLAWPGVYFDAGYRHDPALPQENIAGSLRDAAFRHWEQWDIRRARLNPVPHLKRLLAVGRGRQAGASPDRQENSQELMRHD